MDTPAASMPRCSFCDKSQDVVAVLVASPIMTTPRVYICDECIGVCHWILENRPDYQQSSVQKEQAPKTPSVLGE